MDADARIVAALTETAPATGASAAVQGAWTRLQSKLAEYEECVATSRSGEGLSLSMSIEAAAKQVVEYHQAYVTLRDKAAAATGTNARLLLAPRAFCVDHSLVQMPA